LQHPVKAILALLALLLGNAAAAQDVVSGAASVVNADILGFEGGQRVILWGVDAPERTQPCLINGTEWSCYELAGRQLATLISGGEVTCTLTGEPDPFRRRFGICVAGGVDVNAEMVRSGMALAYVEQTDDYAAAEAEAKAAQVGLWQPGSQFLEPWIHREVESDNSVR